MLPAFLCRRRWTATLLTLLVVSSTAADTQVRLVLRDDDRLRGIRSVDVVVNDTPDGEPRCRLDRGALQSAAVAALQGTGLRATVSDKASSWFHTVEVDVRTVAAGDQCVSALSADLVAHVDGLPEADRGLPPEAWGSLLIGTMRLARDSTIVAALPERHAGQVIDELRSRLTAIGERVRKAGGR